MFVLAIGIREDKSPGGELGGSLTALASQVIKIISAPVKPAGSAFRAGWSRACSGAVLTPGQPPIAPTPAPTLLVLAGHLILQPYSLTILQFNNFTV